MGAFYSHCTKRTPRKEIIKKSIDGLSWFALCRAARKRSTKKFEKGIDGRDWIGYNPPPLPRGTLQWKPDPGKEKKVKKAIDRLGRIG